MSGLGNIAPFRTNYGPASTTQPGFLTTSAQSKTGTMTWITPHVDGALESLGVWRLDEDTSSTIGFENGTTTNAALVPKLKGVNSAALNALILQAIATTDTGSAAVMLFDARKSNNTAVATRPAYDWQNNFVSQMKLDAAGLLTISGGTAPGLTMGGPIQLKSYTVATLPASPAAGKIAYASDAAGNGPCIAMGNGSVWKRCDNTATTVA